VGAHVCSICEVHEEDCVNDCCVDCMSIKLGFCLVKI
jgi:hypothetical protein